MGQTARLQTNIHLFGYLGGGSVVPAWWWDVVVWDGSERMRGWCRSAHEEAQGCERQQ